MQDKLKKNIKIGARIGGAVGLAYTAILGGINIASPDINKNLEFILKEVAFMTGGIGMGAAGGMICGTAWHYLDRIEDYLHRKLKIYDSNTKNY